MKLMKSLKMAVCASAISTAALLASTTANADIVHLDDVIIDFSLCVGNDCVNGESFGFDTVRLKENNLRINFLDTSSSASFPSNDWRLVANDTSNGGSNHFSIEDSTSGRTPFRVEAGASANALVVEADSDIGIGTLNPVVEVHVADGDSPTLRLEQNGTSGFTPQTFDIAANEANFFIRDVTNGSQLPFRIIPGADTDSLRIESDNDVTIRGKLGVGTSNPSRTAHIEGVDDAILFVNNTTTTSTATRAQGYFSNYGPSQIVLEDRSLGDRWRMTGGSTFTINEGGGSMELTLANGGDLTILGSITTGGTMCGSGCDKVFEADYDMPSIEEHAEAMWDKGYLPNVGPTTENQPINMTDKLGRMLNELEKAHIYIDQLNNENKALQERLERLEQKMQ